MKLIFSDPFSDESVAYQRHAIEAVCNLFRGQEICRNEFTVLRDSGDTQARMGFAENDLGIGNRLTLLDDEILANLRAIQLENGVPPSESIDSSDFTVEMETGTGKTYVYLRTILELNKRFGFLKFVIVVPSVAIKEGVYKTLQITEDHFRAIYAGVPVDFFLYDSGKLGQVRNFATSPTIQIMVVTVGAINKKDVNNLYKQNEKTGDYRPIDLIQATNPIVIVDEPQSVDGGLEGRGKEALEAMNPLCTLRYSATHANKHHMVYRRAAPCRPRSRWTSKRRQACVGRPSRSTTATTSKKTRAARSTGITESGRSALREVAHTSNSVTQAARRCSEKKRRSVTLTPCLCSER